MYYAILIIIEGRKTAFNGFWYQFTTGKPLKNLKTDPSIMMRIEVCKQIINIKNMYKYTKKLHIQTKRNRVDTEAKCI